MLVFFEIRNASDIQEVVEYNDELKRHISISFEHDIWNDLDGTGNYSLGEPRICDASDFNRTKTT
jgi:hypothetical protein